ncbi:bifunctional 5,10-methylenetetrahydrofolate dehydrogenase/5,10-methenyltetrahydrofolate cyclohydrolase [Flavobacteriaceae bacterium]|nr:bifunctional 5,10-methylenetetrahydrofolate dehydrogenase/5,10-methenyltetrahydrofolate cyclohydrolase [Flavobacteriaceae bacterium]
MKIIDGKKISNDVLDEIKIVVDERIKNRKKVPHLAAVLVGDDGPSETYVKSKIRACERVGFNSSLFKFDMDISQDELLKEIIKINENQDIDGFIVQLPLPSNIDQEKILTQISPNKDVDGFHPYNYGKMTLGIDTFLPATPAGIVELIKRYKIELSGKKCLVIGRSQIVGLPIGILLGQNKSYANATVTVAHSRTKNLDLLCASSNIIISAIGIPNFLKSTMVSDKTVIIDVGISRIEDSTSPRGYKIVGDVDIEDFRDRDIMITPVPGGVGPMTIAMLLQNTLKACQLND